VSRDVAQATTAHYLAALKAQGTPVDEARFPHEMAVMAAQRNTRSWDVFARLYKRERQGALSGLYAAGVGHSGTRSGASGAG